MKILAINKKYERLQGESASQEGVTRRVARLSLNSHKNQRIQETRILHKNENIATKKDKRLQSESTKQEVTRSS